jgi:hypothetical protein
MSEPARLLALEQRLPPLVPSVSGRAPIVGIYALHRTNDTTNKIIRPPGRGLLVNPLSFELFDLAFGASFPELRPEPGALRGVSGPLDTPMELAPSLIESVWIPP